MTDKELLRGLEEHHRVIRIGLALIQSHCATDCANIAGLEVVKGRGLSARTLFRDYWRRQTATIVLRCRISLSPSPPRGSFQTNT